LGFEDRVGAFRDDLFGILRIEQRSAEAISIVGRGGMVDLQPAAFCLQPPLRVDSSLRSE